MLFFFTFSITYVVKRMSVTNFSLGFNFTFTRALPLDCSPLAKAVSLSRTANVIKMNISDN